MWGLPVVIQRGCGAWLDELLDDALVEATGGDLAVDGDILRELVMAGDLSPVRDALVLTAVRCLPEARRRSAAETLGAA